MVSHIVVIELCVAAWALYLVPILVGGLHNNRSRDAFVTYVNLYHSIANDARKSVAILQGDVAVFLPLIVFAGKFSRRALLILADEVAEILCGFFRFSAEWRVQMPRTAKPPFLS